MQRIVVEGVEIEVTRKRIKNMHLRIIPPDAKVLISAPYLLSQRSVEKFATSKIGWIKRHRQRILLSSPVAPNQFITGESHTLFGETFKLQLVDSPPFGKVYRNGTCIILHSSRNSTRIEREEMLGKWHRSELMKLLPPIIQRYEILMGVKVNEVKIRKMKTRWGSCNPSAKRIWFNLELARRPLHLIEYIVVHEMVHLLERGHNARFYGFMDLWMPDWKSYRKELRGRQ